MHLSLQWESLLQKQIRYLNYVINKSHGAELTRCFAPVCVSSVISDKYVCVCVSKQGINIEW